MKTVFKRTICLVLTAAIIISFGMTSIDSNAYQAMIDWDVIKKYCNIYAVPLEGYTVEEAFPYSGSYGNEQLACQMYGDIYEKDTKKYLFSDDKLEKGKTYHYILTLEKADDSTSFPYEFGIVTIYNAANYADDSCFSNCKTYRDIDKPEKIKFECDVTIGVKPNYNLGTCSVDFAKEQGVISEGDNRFDYILNLLSQLQREGRISNKYVQVDMDNGIFVDDCDLDKDGSFDVRYERKDGTSKIRVLDTCNITGKISFAMTQDYIELKENALNFYYSDYVLEFSAKTAGGNTNNNTNNSNAGQTGGNGNTVNNGGSGSAAITGSGSAANTVNNGGSGSAANTGSGSTVNNGSGDAANAGSGNTSTGVVYENEWVNGQWYGSNGDTSYTAQGSWKCNSTGWWFEDTAGWYPQNQWVKIDGKWYYFLDSGYMDYSEYRDGYWLGADGAWVEGYQNGTWHMDSTGWWFEDNGWYPSNQYLWINGTKYWFNANGYME